MSSYWSLLDCPRPRGRLNRIKRLLGLRVIKLPRQRVVILAATPGHLRDLMAAPESVAPARAVRIMTIWQTIRPGWAGAVDPLPRLRRHQVSLPLRKRGVASITFRLHEPLPLREIVRSGLSALLPVRRMPMPASADIAATGIQPGFLPPSARVGKLPSPDEIRPTDVLLTASPADPGAAGVVLTSDAAQAGGAVLLDAIRINPRGRPDRTVKGTQRLVFGDARSGPTVRSGRLDGIGLDQFSVEMVRRRALVDVGDLAGYQGDPGQAAAILVQVAATGAVLLAPDLQPAVAKLLAPELAAILAEPAPDVTDSVALEVHSIRQRRAALRGHASELVLPRLAAEGFPLLRQLPSVSAILMTRRPEILGPVLDALEKQSYPELEIVVGLHGCPPSDALNAWVARSARPVTVVEVPADVDFGTGLGLVTARSNGSLVTKVDDDDTYGPEHMWDLVLGRHYSGATMVGKGAEFVHLEDRNETIRRKFGNPESFAESVAGGTIMIGRGDLENAGGWRPVPRSVDLGIITRVKADGGLIYRTHPFGYIYHRRAKGHTWDPGQQYFLDSAQFTWQGLPPYSEFGMPLASASV
ncbi:Glycosyltransferase involved in cell wall bisynthesis [Asanoa hainanensis]|uniref:Glycosyltransferase involved in cell wall bisynthesis n=1 Tax=Asanoa hainanensis TaxID=560556 RepID=A0A239MFS2_9ACTN|nr:glycosyltransferase [Asanoa hainanensis]SNT41887.1 Glycosyltransferase involved in cell wall bisynthesis [Asanoa hainanensis]